MPTRRGDLARQRQRERLARAPAGQPVEHRQRQRPPRRERLVRRARQRDDRHFSDAADGRGAARLQRDAMGDHFAAPRQCRDRGIGAADAAAADGDQQIACIVAERARDRRGIARRRPRCAITSAPAARAVSAISCAVVTCPDVAGILTKRSRGRRTVSCSSPAARAISRSSAPNAPARRATTLPSAMSPRCAEPPAPGSLLPAPEPAARLWSTRSESITQSQPSGMASPASTQTGDPASGSGE